MAEVNIGNARDPEQARRMKELNEAGLCYLCREGSEENKTLPNIFHETEYWYITRNDFPFVEGIVHYYMIVPKRHVTKLTDLMLIELNEMSFSILWLEETLKLEEKGFSIFIRNGNMNYTGATLDHLHIQFIVGGPKPVDWKDLEDNIRPTLGFKAK